MANVIDRLIEALNSIDGLSFYRDARMENEPEVNYGVVRLNGESEGQWADGNLIDQAFELSVNVFVKDEREDWLYAVQAALAAFDLSYRLPARNYREDIDAVEWEWMVTIYGPLETEDEDGAANG
ncbi:MAG: hypothetical protein IJ769_05880 [Clostridia bacterium]|nr:hypothetical protein [Clostridia bacterium]